ncbi:MAG: tRNA (adenosine(37)-N6)-dimethylallyltransferase MiaA [Bacteroidia bacterium]|nr:tRNA (adenosine(37)-N6)-dimethylallyltransferase MiaA [Bacteroidia bacterium]
MKNNNLITILGPTASGKTRLAAHVADALHGEVISADSRQVYRLMNIGTGKDYQDYRVGNSFVPVHLVDISEPGSHYNVFHFQYDFTKAFNDITGRGKIPILCGGSGLYIEAVLKAYRLTEAPPDDALRAELEQKSTQELTDMLASMKKLHNTTDTSNRRRLIRAIEIASKTLEFPDTEPTIPEIRSIVFGTQIERDARRQRISERLKARLDEGLVEEVKKLLDTVLSPEQLIYYGLEYKYITQYITGQLDYEEMFTQLETAIRQFAKRQMTWFRRMELNGLKIHWIDYDLPMEEKLKLVMAIMESY